MSPNFRLIQPILDTVTLSTSSLFSSLPLPVPKVKFRRSLSTLKLKPFLSFSILTASETVTPALVEEAKPVEAITGCTRC